MIGKVCLVTGATDGIGKVTARVLAEQGATVIGVGRDPAKIKAVINEIGTTAGSLEFLTADLSSLAQVRGLAAEFKSKYDHLDVLVNNAGIFETKPFLEVDEAYLDRFLNTNLKGTYFTTQAIIPQMLKQHDGVVINIGTPLVNHGLSGVPITAQMVSKGAIHALTIQLAAEFGKDNIRVNTIAPGTIRTPMHGDNADQTAGLHLLNRVGEVEDIAEMVYTVAKSNFINGAIINVDGGLGAGRNLN